MRFKQVKLFIAVLAMTGVITTSFTVQASPGFDPTQEESNVQNLYVNPAIDILNERTEEDSKEETQEIIETIEEIPIIEDTEGDDCFDFTEAEIHKVNNCVMAECGFTEPPEGIRRVADVIWNRVENEKFPDTVDGVISQPNQFTSYWDGHMDKYSDEITDEVKQIVKEEYFDRTDPNILFFTASGYNSYCVPDYRIGNHYFGH